MERDPEGGGTGADGATRRELLAHSSLGAAGLFLRRALPRTDAFPIPADKGFSRAWLDALVARGTPSVARGSELCWIGMPVGGIGCGQLYLGGDGALWLWDIFNQPTPAGFDTDAAMGPVKAVARGGPRASSCWRAGRTAFLSSIWFCG